MGGSGGGLCGGRQNFSRRGKKAGAAEIFRRSPHNPRHGPPIIHPAGETASHDKACPPTRKETIMFKKFIKSAAVTAALAVAAPALAGPNGGVQIEGNVDIFGEQKGAVTAVAVGPMAQATVDNAAIRGNVRIGGNVKITGIQHGAVTAVAVGPGAKARVSNAVITSAE
jgi:hypothetical protein